LIDSKVAKRKRKQSNRLKIILLFVLAPLIVWALAFVIWLYWNNVAKSFTPGTDRRKPAAKASGKLEKETPRGRSDEAQPKENIQDAERKKLDEIIRKENHKTSGNK
jgi:flagellar basal body-associated protein FliL